MIKILSRILLLYLITYAPLSLAFNWNMHHKLCAGEILQQMDYLQEIPIPAGCEAIDCCPGCPAAEYVDWVINIDNQLIQNASLTFDGMDNTKFFGSLITKSEINDSGDIALSGNEIKIFRIPVEINGDVPIAYLKLQPLSNPKILHLLNEIADSDVDSEFSIEVLQYMNEYIVNTFQVKFQINMCLSSSKDHVILQNNILNDSAVALIDYRADSGCVNDQILRANQSASLDNIKSNGNCSSTVSVFSDDNAMSYENNVTTWTDNLNDKHTINLKPVITVPVSVWATTEAQLTMAEADFPNANMLYNQNNVGIQFNPLYTNLTNNDSAISTIGTNCLNGSALSNLQGSAWYSAGQLNMYYVDRSFTGVNCFGDRNINYLGTVANLGSLPHEIGHAYGLRPSLSWGHTNQLEGFGNNNIMWGGGPGTRNQFTAGQAFRINTDTTSMLNVNNNRSGATETCLPNIESSICPSLDIDVTPH